MTDHASPSQSAGAAAMADHASPSQSAGAAVMAGLAALDWDFVEADTQAGGHGVHPYPAKFPPQLPAQMIQELTAPGDLVIDPFGGSGTAVLEAARLGRRGFAIDANPVAARLSRVKGTGLNGSDRRELRTAARAAQALTSTLDRCTEECPALAFVPLIPNQDKWFAATSVHELSHLRKLASTFVGRVRDVLELAIGQAAARVSFQDSETRYVSKWRDVAEGEAIKAFVREVSRLGRDLPESDSLGDIAVAQGDARRPESWAVQDGSAALVVTSPPYPNAYDYHLYHRFRILWTGGHPSELRRVEIGSHLRQQSVADPIADYEADMLSVLDNALRALRPGGWCVLVVGDGVYRGSTYSTSDAISRLGLQLGFEALGVIDRQLPGSRRSVTSAGRRLKVEQIVVLRKSFDVSCEPPAWPMAEYERELAVRERAALTHAARPDLARLTFVRSYRVGSDAPELTQQAKLELSDGSRKKNSTYASHGIHRYKGKFYPQLGRCLINLSCSPGSLVLDPFAGSGTVPLEAALLGHEFHGIELSPVGAATARAKIASMRCEERELTDASQILADLRQRDSREIDWSLFAEGTHEELSSWFAPRILTRMSRVLAEVRRLESAGLDSAAQLARVRLSDIVRDISHQDPSDLRIRRRPVPLEDAQVEELFLDAWAKSVTKILAARAVLDQPASDGSIVTGSSADRDNWPRNPDGTMRLVDAIVSSPPYAAALPYLDTDRLSLAAVFGHTKGARAGLERELVGSREITRGSLAEWRDWLTSEESSLILPGSTTSFLLALSEAVGSDPTAGFRRQQTPAVLTRYFAAMSKVLELAAAHLRPGGHAWFVLGDSKTTIGGRGWTIPTTNETAAIAKHHGLDFEEAVPITVTRDNMRHARHAITKNTLLHFVARA